MNILVIGAGAIGSLVGGRLAMSGAHVTLVGRQAFADTIRGNGLWLHDDQGQHQITNLQAAATIEEAISLSSSAFDLAILTVKSYDTAAALHELASAVSRAETSVPALFSLQNGVGNEEEIATTFPEATVLAGTITTPVSVSEIGIIQVDKPNNAMGISAWRPRENGELLVAAQQSLQRAGFDIRRYDVAHSMKWTKLLMNMLGNATSAILDMPPHAVFANPVLVDIEIDAWHEAMAVMRASAIRGVNIGSYPFAILVPVVPIVPRVVLRRLLRQKIGSARGGKMPSLHIDLERGRQRSEVEWLNGAVVRQGQRCQIETPVNRKLTDVLLALAADPQQRAGWRQNAERLAVEIRQERDT